MVEWWRKPGHTYWGWAIYMAFSLLQTPIVYMPIDGASQKSEPCIMNTE